MSREHGTTSFAWLHISDMHLGYAEELWPNVWQSIRWDLSKLKPFVGKLDAVFFTGDMVQRGDAPNIWKQLDSRLKDLWEYFGSELECNPCLATIPGNHDLVWQDGPAAQRLLAMLDDEGSRVEFWNNPDSEMRQCVRDAFKDYSAWENGRTLPRKIPERIDGLLPGDHSSVLEKDGIRLGIVGLNTAFMQIASGSRVRNPKNMAEPFEERLALDVRQLNAACGGDGARWTEDKVDVALLLTHHPPGWLTPTAHKHYRSEIYLRDRFAGHLFGHRHALSLTSMSAGGAAALNFWQGTSLFGLQTFSDGTSLREHGYTLGRLTINGADANVRLWPRISVKHEAGHRELRPDPTKSLEEDGGTSPIPVIVRRRNRDRSPPDPAIDVRGRSPLVDYVAQVLDEVSSWHGLVGDKRINLRDHYVPHLAGVGDSKKGEIDESAILQNLRQNAGAAIIEGPAGSGKTTLLRNWARGLADWGKAGEDAGSVPLLVPLVRVAELCVRRNRWDLGPGTVAAALHPNATGCADTKLNEALDQAIASGRAVLMFDAFDEVPADLQTRMKAWLDRARQAARGCPIVVASRPCQLIRGFEKFDPYYLRPFNAEQRRTFVRRWFEAKPGPEQAAHAVAALLAEPIMKDERIAGSPLFLAMVCAQFDEDQGRLACNRAELLRYFSRLLLQKEARNCRFSADRKGEVLEALATTMLDGPRRRLEERTAVEIANRTLASRADQANAGDAVLAEIVDSGLLEIDVFGYYEFRHTILVDYFAACDIFHRSGTDRASRIDGAIEWVGARPFDDASEEIEEINGFLQELIAEERH